MAVEFVHPVIMGKRALPAFALTGSDLVARAGVAVRTGDILIAVAGGQDADVADLMRRAPAWGAASAWIGSGPRPPAGAADHVLWIDDPDPMAPATGRFVLLYHLLWELTHVCFEHSGLLTEPAAVILPGAGPAGRPAVKREPEATAFLYPFIEADERDAGALLAELATSARAKTMESATLQQATLADGEAGEPAHPSAPAVRAALGVRAAPVARAARAGARRVGGPAGTCGSAAPASGPSSAASARAHVRPAS